MKIEKISEFQIRCTLTSEDLADRHIRLSELAYGSEAARQLFHDMMLQARKQVGFDADNIPLMIEAIPVSPDSIMLVITKVNNPEELDTRFAKFAPSDNNKPSWEAKPALEGADAILNLLQKSSKHSSASDSKNMEKDPEVIMNIDFVRLYKFRDIDSIIEASNSLTEEYTGINTLYMTGGEYPYSLIIHKTAHSAVEFNRICNTISEYGVGAQCSTSRELSLNEHAKTVIANNALQELQKLKR